MKLNTDAFSLTYSLTTGTDFWGLLNPDWNLCNRGKRQSPINIDPQTLLFDPDLGAIRVEEARITGTLENNGHSIIFRTLTAEESLLQASSPPALHSPSLLLEDPLEHSSSTFKRNSHHHHDHGMSNSTSYTQALVSSVPGNEVSPIPQSSSLMMMTSPESPSVSITGGPFSYNYQFDSIYLHFGRTDLHGSEHVVAGVSFPAEVSLVFFLLLACIYATTTKTTS